MYHVLLCHHVRNYTKSHYWWLQINFMQKCFYDQSWDHLWSGWWVLYLIAICDTRCVMFLSSPVRLHSGLICIAFCMSVTRTKFISHEPLHIGPWNMVRAWTWVTLRSTLRFKVKGQGHQVKKRVLRPHLTGLQVKLQVKDHMGWPQGWP